MKQIKRYQPCGKARYATERQAIRVAMSSSRRSGLPLRVYRCPECKGWHLTKRPTWRPAARKPTTPAKVTDQAPCTCGRCTWTSDLTSTPTRKAAS